MRDRRKKRKKEKARKEGEKVTDQMTAGLALERGVDTIDERREESG